MSAPTPKSATKAKPRRRAQGEGTLFKRSSDGMWVGALYVTSPDGKYRQKRVYAKEHRAARKKLDDLKAELAAGVVANRRMTVAAWLETWLEIHRPRVRPLVFARYQSATRNIGKTLGKKKLTDLTPADVRALHNALGVGRSRTTRAHNVLSLALDQAVTDGLVARNVAALVRRPPESKTEREAFDVDTAKAVLKHALTLSDMESARWMFALLQGMRPGEVLGLTWPRVDLDRGSVEVSAALQKLPFSHGCGDKQADGKWPCGRQRCITPTVVTPPGYNVTQLRGAFHLTPVKTSGSNRVVPLVGPLLETLRRLKESDGGGMHGLIFHTPDGGPVDSVNDRKAWAQLLKDAGVIDDGDDVPDLHSARHTAATLLEAAGVPESVRMQILGHVSISAHRGYAHGDFAQNKAAVESLEHLFE